MIRNCNDGTTCRPYLRCDLNGGNLADLPVFSTAPRGDERTILEMVKAAGFGGFQGSTARNCNAAGLKCTGAGRVNKLGEADRIAEYHAAEGVDCVTLHVGWGIEDDSEAGALIEDILNASQRHNMPLFIETHRATIMQDIWRAVQFVKRYPEIRFNGDFSHWYTGLEMVYGNITEKFEFMMPVTERVRFIHGRIGNPGCMQVDIGDGTNRPYVDHFKEMWTRSFVGFLRNAKPGDFICFTPELLPPNIYYARVFKNAQGQEIEEGDRWEQALRYLDLAKGCFAEAQRRLAAKI